MMLIKYIISTLLLSMILLSTTLEAQERTVFQTKNIDEEYSLKAVFTLNFARLTQWPYSDNSSITFCIMGNNSMLDAFKLIEHKRINSKNVTLKIISHDKDIINCQVLFLSGISHSRIRKLYSYARNHPILTISEAEDISRSGAIINFIQNGDKIRFQINLNYSHQAGLKLSSRLLKLAIISE